MRYDRSRVRDNITKIGYEENGVETFLSDKEVSETIDYLDRTITLEVMNNDSLEEFLEKQELLKKEDSDE